MITNNSTGWNKNTPIIKRSSSRLTVDLLWRSGGGADLINGKKKVPRNYHSKPLRSKPVVDIDDDFKAEFQEFKDYSNDEVDIDVKPFTFSSSKKTPAFEVPNL
ncbi:ethylene-responsive transcription factor Related to AP22-12-like [Forsythia ovata]|uniref:Ethylene-responsive transcription factor Related to AP22-12-like n=1 Tax=Forsythia ovata TaxID=205694 RepID=A0ABD1VNG3_9LAMI